MFAEMQTHDHEALHLCRDARTGMQALIAIHNTRLGPALGGCRFVRYHCEQAALDDVLRLSRGMSYKAALAGVPYGGGKSVMLKPDHDFDREAWFTAFGDFVETLGGRYITAVDSGSTVADLAVVARRTTHVTSATERDNPAPWTALGVCAGIQAAVQARLGRDSLAGIHVAIQGVGQVGYPLAARLRAAGAKISIADIDEVRVQKCAKDLQARIVSPEEICSLDCDVLAPCGLGGVITQQTLPELRCSVIAGSANNQLAEENLAAALHAGGILYAPDYVINAGGLIAVALAHAERGRAEVENRTRAIGDTLRELFRRAAADACTPVSLAQAMAEERIARGPEALPGQGKWSKVAGL